MSAATDTAALSGALTIGFAVERHAQLLELMLAGPTCLDLAGVSDCDVSGVQLLLAARRGAHAAGRRLAFQHAPQPVADALQRCGVALAD